jgi:predicted SAM-dependent methyltransferase
MNNEYVQYGCGFSAPDGWKNYDASLTLRFERLPVIGGLHTKNDSRFPENIEFGNIVSGLPVDENSCEGVYCSHVLEHLSLEDFRIALRNTHKILKSGGCFRLVLPDLEYAIKQYINNLSVEASYDFLIETSLGQERRSKGLRGLLSSWLGNSQHLWMWDYKSIAHELANAGFINIRKASFGDAEDTIFNQVEDESRWQDCLGVECYK